MKKNLLLSLLFFAAGFLTHAFFFPDVLSNGIVDVQQVAIPNTEQSTGEEQSDNQNLTTIEFDGKKFSRNNVTIGFTRYIQIINKNESHLMWLVSDIPELTTKRGYAHLEAVQTQFNKKGQFVVVNKDNPKEKLVITVK